MKEEIDRRDMEKNFLFLHRQAIIKMYNDIYKRKVMEYNNLKKGLKLWVTLIYLMKISKNCFWIFDVIFILMIG